MKTSSLILSAAMTLGACAGREPAEYSPSVPQQAAEDDSAAEHEQSSSDLKKPTTLEEKERLRTLLIEQTILLTRMELMDPEIVMACTGLYNDCFSAQIALFKKNIPGAVISECEETLYDPKDTCIDLAMMRRNLASELIDVYEAGNSCLRKVTECPTVDKPFFYGQEPKIKQPSP